MDAIIPGMGGTGAALIFGFLAGLIVGVMGYRYFYKRDAAKVEELAARLKELGEKV